MCHPPSGRKAPRLPSTTRPLSTRSEDSPQSPRRSPVSVVMMSRPAVKAAPVSERGKYLPSTVLSGLVGLVAVILYAGIGREHQYVFTPEEMHAIARRAVERGNDGTVTPNTQAIFESVVADLREKYGDYIIQNPPWMLNNAGGAMGSMMVLHCSLSEYVIIFGSPVGTEGHTGRFLADDYFTILQGQQWAYETGRVTKEVYRAGDQHLMPRGVAKQYRLLEDSWALEYARGNVLSMIPFGLLDTFSSTMDFVSLWQTVKVSAVGMVSNLLRGKV